MVGISAGDTGTLDTLNDVSLQEGIENKQRKQNEQTAGITDCCIVEFSASV